MNYKNIVVPIGVFLILSIIVFTVTQVWGMPIKDIAAGIVAYALYGVLVTVYFLRFALIFIGVFAVYRFLQERHNKQLTA